MWKGEINGEIYVKGAWAASLPIKFSSLLNSAERMFFIISWGLPLYALEILFSTSVKKDSSAI